MVGMSSNTSGTGKGLRIISLGQGQGPIAEKAIDLCQKLGYWLCLQNCHLSVSWLSKLEQIIEKMSSGGEPGGKLPTCCILLYIYNF